MVGWHHQFNEHEFEQTLGDGKGQGSLACCSPWGSQRIKHNLVTKQHQAATVYKYYIYAYMFIDMFICAHLCLHTYTFPIQPT